VRLRPEALQDRFESRGLIETLYWASTGLLAAAMVGAGIQELRHAPELVEETRRLGYPEHLLTMLGFAKLAGAPFLVIQKVPRLKEWVYAGFSFDFAGAIFSHTVVGDTLIQTLPAILCASFLAVSYGCHRARGPVIARAKGAGGAPDGRPPSGVEPGARLSFLYRVDAEDRIRFVSAEWLEFARENAAPDLVRDAVVGRSLWEFVAGGEAQHLYRLLFESARRGQGTIRIPFRCDSPTIRRFMELTIDPAPDETLDLCGSILREEPRPRVALLDPSSPRGDEFVLICSWCKRIRVAPDVWDEAEQAIRTLGLFGATVLPGLSHGICDTCEATIDAEIAG